MTPEMPDDTKEYISPDSGEVGQIETEMPKQKKGYGLLGLAVLLSVVSAGMVLPKIHVPNILFSFKTVFFAPFFSGIFGGFLLGAYLDVLWIGFVIGAAITFLGWYCPLAILMVKDPPLSRLQKGFYWTCFVVIWACPTVMVAYEAYTM